MKLAIKEVGFEVKLPGVPIFRTPANVNISGLDLTILVSILKNVGITSFEIINDDKVREFKVFSKNNKKEINTNENEKVEIIKLINERFNKLENLILNMKIINEKADNIKIKKKYKIDDLEDNTFIPEININNMKMNKTNDIIIKNTKKDIENDVDLLSEILKKNN